ncbi:hypothetical protein CEXT_607091 [Caerostris extrusa]|uniref:Ycf15 n=1 Tax=Caerostris extrusa TaxID=172846 RepID=A0AAV4VHA1_CAEEX|nr:hypothetical protein CEXT_607091 [Caerostris extrusa]
MIHIIVCCGNQFENRRKKWRQDFFVPVCREEEKVLRNLPTPGIDISAFGTFPIFEPRTKTFFLLFHSFYSIRMERGGSFASWDRFQPS